MPEPRDLTKYHNAVNLIDQRYWQCEEEVKQDNLCNPPSKGGSGGKKGGNSGNSGSSGSSSNSNPSSSSSTQSSGQQGKKLNWSGNKNSNWKGNSGSSQSSGQSSNQSGFKSSPLKPHAKHLGPDSKVKPKELEPESGTSGIRVLPAPVSTDGCLLKTETSIRGNPAPKIPVIHRYFCAGTHGCYRYL